MTQQPVLQSPSEPKRPIESVDYGSSGGGAVVLGILLSVIVAVALFFTFVIVPAFQRTAVNPPAQAISLNYERG